MVVAVAEEAVVEEVMAPAHAKSELGETLVLVLMVRRQGLVLFL
jgi:hypothetical protein